ncbi:MAG: RNA-directed DNA polymerase [Deltaproteobacteria bacterium]|nr:RNA-directed DNA polymerase [Deltaproteobacteria bacterium]
MAGFWDRLKQLFGDGPSPKGSDPDAGPPSSSRSPSRDGDPVPPASSKAGAQSPEKGQKSPARSYDANPEILGLSESDLRKRALRITPWRTAWIGRVDTIPPQSDERTAIIDRGLILTGRLSEAEIAEIHEVGDLWLKHHGKADLARAEAKKASSAAIAELHAEREAKRKQKKEEAAERRRLRADGIAERRRTDIIFAGRSVSSRLADRRANVEKLVALGLPVLATPRDVAELLGISVSKLRWLAFHAEATERPHYVTFHVKKRSGGLRLLSAPHKELKRAQKKIATQILDRLDVGPAAHGFVKGRSTVSNAKIHLGQDVVLNLDLSDFFPTISFPRVRGLFQSFGYSPAAATLLALVATEAPRRVIKYEGRAYHVATGPRALPQGAPTSPALANLAARKLDRRLLGLAKSAGWVYSRYADDLTFSTKGEPRKKTPWVFRQISEIVSSEGFVVHPRKRRVQHKGGRQTVTGVVVNEKLGLPRDEVRRLRAILHGAKKNGLASQNRDGRSDFPAYLRGKLAYLAMIDPGRGKKMLRELDVIEGRKPAPT